MESVSFKQPVWTVHTLCLHLLGWNLTLRGRPGNCLLALLITPNKTDSVMKGREEIEADRATS